MIFKDLKKIPTNNNKQVYKFGKKIEENYKVFVCLVSVILFIFIFTFSRETVIINVDLDYITEIAEEKYE